MNVVAQHSPVSKVKHVHRYVLPVALVLLLHLLSKLTHKTIAHPIKHLIIGVPHLVDKNIE